jgi:hypothetical protein
VEHPNSRRDRRATRFRRRTRVRERASWSSPNDFVCARDRDDPVGGCGCGRAFVGLGSRKATTTALVRDLDISPADLRAAVEEFEVARGLGPDVIGPEDFAELVEAKLEELDDIARSVQVGAVVGLRLGHLVWRRYPARAETD